MPPPLTDPRLLRRQIFDLPSLGEVPSPVVYPPLEQERPELAPPPAEISDQLPQPGPLAEPDPISEAYENVRAGMFEAPRPERRSGWKQALGYAVHALGGPLSSTDIPQRLIYKTPPIDPARRQKQFEMARTAGADRMRAGTAAGRLGQDEAELSALEEEREATQGRAEAIITQREEEQKSREGIAARRITATEEQAKRNRETTWAQLGYIQVPAEQMEGDTPSPGRWDSSFTDSDGTVWGKLKWELKTDHQFLRALALIKARLGIDTAKKVADLKSAKEKRHAEISDGLAKDIADLKWKAFNSSTRDKSGNSYPFPDDTVSDENLNEYTAPMRRTRNELAKDLFVHAAEAKAKNDQVYADALEEFGVENTDPVIDYPEQDLNEEDIQRLIAPVMSKEEAKAKRLFIEAFGREVGEPPNEQDLESGRRQQWKFSE